MSMNLLMDAAEENKADPLTGTERFFDKSEVIVSKTDLKGRINYANRVFRNICDYSDEELIGAPHSLIRHPDMPRCIFKFLWDTLARKQEIFAYVVNRAKNGDHYWVFAHVTPSFGVDGNVIGYHSSRRVPDRRVVEGTIIPLYKMLSDEEARHANRKDGMHNALGMLTEIMKKKGVAYDELIFSLSRG